jgi:hypothetical protein
MGEDVVPLRYANVLLVGRAGELAEVLPVGEKHEVAVGIGALAAESRVERPVPFPDQLLPRNDIELDVLFASSSLLIGGADGELRHGTVSRRLMVPAGGGPSVSLDDGSEFVRFLVVREFEEEADARLAYYFNGTAVQSQKITVDGHTGRFRVRTDFTITNRWGVIWRTASHAVPAFR